MSKIRTVARHQLVKAITERYRTSSPEDKRRIQDEFTALTGYPPKARDTNAQQR